MSIFIHSSADEREWKFLLTLLCTSYSLDPIWTIKTGGLFLLKLTTEELFTSNGLVCEVMDFDKFGGNDKLGLFTVPPKVLFEAQGERLEYDLLPSKGAENVSVSSLMWHAHEFRCVSTRND